MIIDIIANSFIPIVLVGFAQSTRPVIWASVKVHQAIEASVVHVVAVISERDGS